MAVYQEFLNLDNYYNKTSGNKLILNDIEFLNNNERESLNEAMYTVYDSSTISMIPSCDCGEMNVAYLEGRTCEKCSTEVRDPFVKRDPLIWMRNVEGMPKFINPHFWLMLRNVMSTNLDCLRWLTDTSYNPPKELPSFLKGLSNTLPNFERSYPYFVDNIRIIMVYLSNHHSFKTVNKVTIIKGLIKLYDKNKNLLYSQYLPIVNKRLFVMENTSKGKFTNLGVSEVIDLVLSFITSLNAVKLTNVKKSTIMGRTISKQADIFYSYYSNYAGKKPGMFRKHNYGARSHFTFRAVITSIAGPHAYDEIHIPWSIGVTVFRPHLLNILVNRKGLTYKKASSLLFAKVKAYDPLIDECLNILLAETKQYRSIDCLLQRNPSLLQGSLQLVRITKIKIDPADTTISMSILITAAFNADYDGDELNVTLLLENNLAKMFETFKPHHNVPGLNKLYEVSSNLSLPKPAIATLTNYLDKQVPGINNTSNLEGVEVVMA